MSNLINSIRDYILTCPFLSDWRVNVDYLGDGMEYSIDPLPCDPVIQRYTDGGRRSNFNSLLPAVKNMTRMRGLILKTVDSTKILKNGWKHRVWQGYSLNWEKRKSLLK